VSEWLSVHFGAGLVVHCSVGVTVHCGVGVAVHECRSGCLCTTLH